jgi:hypothetical protein
MEGTRLFFEEVNCTKLSWCVTRDLKLHYDTVHYQFLGKDVHTLLNNLHVLLSIPFAAMYTIFHQSLKKIVYTGFYHIFVCMPHD